MKYLALFVLLAGSGVTALISNNHVDLGERIAYNITVMRGQAIEAQAFHATSDAALRMAADPLEMMRNLPDYAYGTSVPFPLSEEALSTEHTIYKEQAEWMGKLSENCQAGKQYLSEKLYQNRRSGFSYLVSHKWLRAAEQKCS